MHLAVISFLKLSLPFSFCIALLSCTAQAQETGDQKFIADLEKQRTDAITLGDEKALGDLLDESFTGVTATGKVVNKSEQVAIFKSTNPYVTFTAENMAINVYASVATVTGTLVGRAKSGSVIGKTRYLYVYLKKDGQWKVINSQETVVLKE